VQDVVDLVFNPLRSVISQNRRRYTEDDVTDITDRIIAMGYPARSIERLYRNSMYHTVKFLERHHAGHYKVFNLRGNYFYKVEKFHGRVGLYHMKDHQPPRLDLMDPFCKEVNTILASLLMQLFAKSCANSFDVNNFTGRTGVMICAYLVSIKFYEEPRQVMDYYSIVRTVNNKGVTIPSQRRYVYYYAQMLKYGLTYTPLRIELVGVYVERPPQPGVTFKGDLVMRVTQSDIEMFTGAPITISRQQWCCFTYVSSFFTLFVKFLFRIDEEKLWSGKVPFGEDSYDPSSDSFDVKNTCVSRFAYS
uniref:Phosphatase tensin-type domain-containing protein n=1 Tax=Angiostrongylus cantonensis TaxID=6313 RepID=A0A0K0DKY5_ANGCA